MKDVSKYSAMCANLIVLQSYNKFYDDYSDEVINHVISVNSRIINNIKAEISTEIMVDVTSCNEKFLSGGELVYKDWMFNKYSVSIGNTLDNIFKFYIKESVINFLPDLEEMLSFENNHLKFLKNIKFDKSFSEKESIDKFIQSTSESITNLTLRIKEYKEFFKN